jgi:DNA-binding NarL/FixJ family response regulator
MDIQLPGASGLDVTKEIKRVYNDIVVVILSSNSQLEYRQEAYRNGADYFISKDDACCMENILTRVDVALAKASNH